MTLGDFISLAHLKFRDAGLDTPLNEAHYLVCRVLDIERTQLVLREAEELSGPSEIKLKECLERRLAGEPLAYIVGYRDFFKSRFNVRPGVLIPRPETELLVEEALKQQPNFRGPFIDMGCGSGCIGLSLLKEWPDARLLAMDNSPVAIQVTEENARSLGLKARMKTCEGAIENQLDFLSQEFGRENVELIVANPPYIAPNDENVDAAVRKYEPHQALFAEEQGLAAIWSWLKIVDALLQIDGHAIFEIGFDQAQVILKDLPEKVPGLAVESIIKDLSGHNRILVIRRKR